MNKAIIWIFLLFILLNTKKYLNQLQIWRWMRALKLKQHLKVFNQITTNINGFELSKIARKDYDLLEYTYGEINFIHFIALLSQVNPNEDTIFYDLGSGTGKAIFACSMVFNVKKSIGIEIFQDLKIAALTQQQRLLKLPAYSESAKKIQFINSDFLNADFSDANLIFINATGLFGEIWLNLSNKLDKLEGDVTIITTSKKLPSKYFIIKKITKVQMSWGVVNAFIHKRI